MAKSLSVTSPVNAVLRQMADSLTRLVGSYWHAAAGKLCLKGQRCSTPASLCHPQTYSSHPEHTGQKIPESVDTHAFVTSSNGGKLPNFDTKLVTV